jgi:hypothetical protein
MCTSVFRRAQDRPRGYWLFCRYESCTSDTEIKRAYKDASCFKNMKTVQSRERQRRDLEDPDYFKNMKTVQSKERQRRGSRGR